MLVDDRHNYMMIGATMPLLFYVPHKGWIFIMGIIALSLAVSLIMRWTKAMGEADQKAIFWSFLGFAALSKSYLISYVIIFIFTYILYFLIKKMFKLPNETAGMPIFLLSFCCNVYLISYWWHG